MLLLINSHLSRSVGQGALLLFLNYFRGLKVETTQDGPSTPTINILNMQDFLWLTLIIL